MPKSAGEAAQGSDGRYVGEARVREVQGHEHVGIDLELLQSGSEFGERAEVCLAVEQDTDDPLADF